MWSTLPKVNHSQGESITLSSSKKRYIQRRYRTEKKSYILISSQHIYMSTFPSLILHFGVKAMIMARISWKLSSRSIPHLLTLQIKLNCDRRILILAGLHDFSEFRDEAFIRVFTVVMLSEGRPINVRSSCWSFTIILSFPTR